jgi:pimeloyl-ACP methyl ester carboxylesterase/predicted glycosyltransferase
MRAQYPHTDGFAANPTDGARIFYEVFGPGDAPRTIVFLPTWTVLPSAVWKAQVPYFSRQGFRVVTFDNRGNGRSDRPATGYSVDRIVEDALTVMDAAGVGSAALVTLSAGARWGVKLAAQHPERATHLVLISPSLRLGPPPPHLEHFWDVLDRYEGIQKYNAAYWKRDYADFLRFWSQRAFPEAHSLDQIEESVAWGLETTPEVLIATVVEGGFPEAADLLGRTRLPTLIVRGSEDQGFSHEAAEVVQRAIRGAELVVLEGCGHGPSGRDPVRTNLLLHEFLGPIRAPVERVWRRASARNQKRALFVSSPIGLGHARRDLALATALRRIVPDLQIDWLTQEPVTSLLLERGESIHPRSRQLASEVTHVEAESHSATHDLHAFQAFRRMSEILVANFLTFLDAARDVPYDLWIADEGWDVDYFLHENPELKTAPYVWLTDFVGLLPMLPGEGVYTADRNAEMIEQVARFPRVRDLALFVGNPADVVPDRFGPNLPEIREWTDSHYDFPGYLQYFDPAAYVDRATLRKRLGFESGEPIVVAAVGGTGVGRGLLQRFIQAMPEVRNAVPGLRMLVVAGPRIDPAGLPTAEGVEVRGYVPDLFEYMAACDLSLVQGGLSTTMELVATGRPFLYFPLHNHFEQMRHVPHRLANYGVGASARADFSDLTPDFLADRVAHGLAHVPEYRPVETGGPEGAARLIANLL